MRRFSIFRIICLILLRIYCKFRHFYFIFELFINYWSFRKLNWRWWFLISWASTLWRTDRSLRYFWRHIWHLRVRNVMSLLIMISFGCLIGRKMLISSLYFIRLNLTNLIFGDFTISLFRIWVKAMLTVFISAFFYIVFDYLQFLSNCLVFVIFLVHYWL